MQQHTIRPNKGATKRRKRIGRGNGSTWGTYSGRGMNGQSARTGGRRKPGFEGGQTPLLRRMPKLKGFKNPNKVYFQVINVSALEVFDDGSKVDVDTLFEKGVIRTKKHPIKILGNGEITKKVEVTADAVSKSAEEKVTKAGGTVTGIISQVTAKNKETNSPSSPSKTKTKEGPKAKAKKVETPEPEEVPEAPAE